MHRKEALFSAGQFFQVVLFIYKKTTQEQTLKKKNPTLRILQVEKAFQNV